MSFISKTIKSLGATSRAATRTLSQSSQKRFAFVRAGTYVYLHQDVQGYGEAGQIIQVTVKEARNWLIPFRMADYVPKFDGASILPTGWTPPIDEDQFAKDPIVPAVAVSSPNPAELRKQGTGSSEEAPLSLFEFKDKLIQLKELHFERTTISEASDDGRIYGSVSSEDVSHALEEHSIIIPSDAIVIPGGRIKSLGSHQVNVRLGEFADLNVALNIHVKRGKPNPATP
ncbi:uncharacterized protein BJ171DRAFT_510883 [Polychytrium aggregatum]|uniref:uncharacterized protein n=1 Tax=Polychytrium aggregatum TaxID=110093 RepID=UPI0022FF00AA|nr:uncharacterized protein BJ171DRAFT_510883 [Polychytrium aggregatum]KAI9203099.1 hypothetical protein BJ171DRAFT_510883 [Polychytrium aggregatum]